MAPLGGASRHFTGDANIGGSSCCDVDAVAVSQRTRSGVSGSRAGEARGDGVAEALVEVGVVEASSGVVVEKGERPLPLFKEREFERQEALALFACDDAGEFNLDVVLASSG